MRKGHVVARTSDPLSRASQASQDKGDAVGTVDEADNAGAGSLNDALTPPLPPPFDKGPGTGGGLAGISSAAVAPFAAAAALASLPGKGMPPKNGYRYRALAYLRVSREDAQTGSHTFETQEMRVREKLDRLFGGPEAYELVIEQDNGVSGSYGPQPYVSQKRYRKGLQAALEQLRTGTFDVFAVYKLDRFARSPRVFHQTLDDDILPYSRFISATEDLDFDTPQGRVMLGIMAAISGYFRDGVVVRNQDAAATRVKQGYYQGQVPYGWQWEPIADVPPGGRRRIRPLPEQGRWIVQSKDWYLAGWSLFKIVSRLNEMGVPPPSANKAFSVRRHEAEGRIISGKWSSVVLGRVLSCPLHAGLVSGREGIVQGEHFEHRFYDLEVRERILEVYQARKRTTPTNTASRHDDRLLNGLVTCARCGKRLYPTTHSHGKYRVFRCMTGLNTGALTCPGVSAREDELEQALLHLVERLAQTPCMQDLMDEEARRASEQEEEHLRTERNRLQERAADLDAQFARLVNLLTRELITEAEFKPQADALRAQQEAARAELGILETRLDNGVRREEQVERVREILRDFPTVWEHLHLDERREVMRQLLEELSVDRDEAASGPTLSGNVVSRVRVRLIGGVLPQQEIVLRHHKVKRKEKPSSGIAGLTPRHLAYLYWRLEGLDGHEAAERMQVQHNTIRIFEQQIRKRLGIQDILEAARLARGRILAEKGTLPVGGNLSSEARAKREEGQEALYLSPTLMEVLPLFAQGATTKEVAEITGLSLTTVVGRKARILEATHCRTLFAAAQKARKAGLL